MDAQPDAPCIGDPRWIVLGTLERALSQELSAAQHRSSRV